MEECLEGCQEVGDFSEDGTFIVSTVFMSHGSARVVRYGAIMVFSAEKCYDLPAEDDNEPSQLPIHIVRFGWHGFMLDCL